VDEYYGASGIELFIERIEALVSEIDAAEIGFQDDAIRALLRLREQGPA